MGLDMYLDKNGSSYKYWRKANAIHGFFVDNVQDGIDDCRPHKVGRDHIVDLKERCECVLRLLETCPRREQHVVCGFENGVERYCSINIYDVDDNSPIANLLPPCHGFFFGNYDYDDNYKKDVEETLEMCNNLLAEVDWDNDTIEYQSSW